MQTLGVLLEGLGVIVAIVGLHQRFRAFAAPDASEINELLGPIRDTFIRLRRSAQARWNRIRGRRQHVVAAGVAVGIAMTVRTRGRVGWGPLPVARSNKPALAELDRRLRDLLKRVDDLSDRVEDNTDRTDADIRQIREDLQAEIARLREQIERLAIGDVSLQYLGLGMIGVGILLQIFGRS